MNAPGSLAAGASPGWSILARHGDRIVTVIDVTPAGAELSRRDIAASDLPALIAGAPPARRWVWNDAPRWYPALLRAGVEVPRCHDLRLCHAILCHSALVTAPEPLRAARQWDAPAAAPAVENALFDFDEQRGVPEDATELIAEFARQQAAVTTASSPERLRLLLAAESAGALIACELQAAGLPWDAATHDRLLVEALGARPGAGGLPTGLQDLAARVREALGDPGASLDSQPKLLKALQRVGITARTTSRWELAEFDHPVIAPLLEYKKGMRLLTANGWDWLAEWAPDGRFRPVYVPGGVVTGRWASSGGGALQLPRLLRPAVRADPGWTLVVADVAQLEPRVLAAMARDTALADAARGTDLYEGIVSGGVVTTRQEAKIALLGAMYGATTGDSGRLVPALRRAFPRAMALVDSAAEEGEKGGVVSTWLGRTSPPASAAWRDIQSSAGSPDAGEDASTAARRTARDRGRFTRNFIVQGSAAEWALAWLADLRMQLAEFPLIDAAEAASASGPVFSRRAHLAFFLHDEIIVHTPAAHAERAAEAVRQSAERATKLLFGDFPLDFRLDLRITDDAAKS